ncbi:dihydrolipoyl dehydrogenase [Psychrobacter jeotgali]|uniref:dihydrolipoyl dehydrogenase n=1 Tax=Psychrobacter jeotgali TaxID=179010 RepID=UPI00191A5DB4|nr:dihydrolipoyl dehydrogenase [Psychrobacter jeotgali]
MTKRIEVDVAIIGAGTGGMYALREVRRANKSFVLIDKGPLGTTCARVGCMPSKVALHIAEYWSSKKEFPRYGISGAEHLRLDSAKAWQALREQRDQFADSAAGNAKKGAGKHLIMGEARFLEPTLLEVEQASGTQQVKAKSVIIANGSRPVMPRFLEPFSEHCITTDEFFEMEKLPKSIGILGLGAIGLEMGLALARLGVEVHGADMAQTVAGISDPEVSDIALAEFAKEIHLYLGAPAELVEAEQGVVLKAGDKQVQVDKVLVALGRRPNTDQLNLAEAGFELDALGQPLFNVNTLQLGTHPVFIVGDVNGYRPLMHEAADEGAMAGYNAVQNEPIAFKRKTPFAIAFTNPDVISVGTRFDELNKDEVLIGTALSQANGRSRVLTDREGILRLYADKSSGKLLGASMIGVRGEHVAQLLVLAIERGETAHSLLQMPFYHPVVEEIIQSALQDIVRKIPDAAGLPFGLALAE